jgi:two-component system sensor kinase FixL
LADSGAKTDVIANHATRAFLAAIVQSSNDPIIGLNLDGVITSWNDAATRLFGHAASAMVGGSIMRLIPPERAAEEQSILRRVGGGERLAHFETERLTKDGRLVPVSLTVSPIFNEAGAVVGISKIVRDLGELQRLNRELQRREALLQSILDTVPDGLIVIDPKGMVQAFNQAAESMFGYAAAEVVGRNVRMLMPGHHAAAHDGYMDRYMTTGEKRIIGIGRLVAGLHKDGGTFPLELRVGEVQAAGTHLFTGILRDVTEREARDHRLAELQAELIHVSRVSELGQMVSALAHEVNQPLTAVANYLSGIRRLLPEDSPAPLRPALEKVAEQAERARAIVQSLRGLVRKEPAARQVENLETMVQETSALVLIGTNRLVVLRLQVQPDAVLVLVDRVQIQQVLLNLMRNAVEAMARQSLRMLTIAAERLGDRVQITVSDTGPGLSNTVQARLFQPFVTTKPEGLGVGLSICRTIVESHGGALSVVDGTEPGTTFRFTVPAADPETLGTAPFTAVTDLDQ